MTPREIALSICEPWFNGDPCDGCECHKVCTKLVDRIEAAIQAERVPETNFGTTPQPVAYISGYNKGRCIIEAVDREFLLPVGMALYRSPFKREPLRDEEIEEICWTEMDRRLLSFARAIERAHGIGGEE